MKIYKKSCGAGILPALYRVHFTLANMFVGAKHDRNQYGIITNNLYPVMLLQASKTRCTPYTGFYGEIYSNLNPRRQPHPNFPFHLRQRQSQIDRHPENKSTYNEKNNCYSHPSEASLRAVQPPIRPPSKG